MELAGINEAKIGKDQWYRNIIHNTITETVRLVSLSKDGKLKGQDTQDIISEAVTAIKKGY